MISRSPLYSLNAHWVRLPPAKRCMLAGLKATNSRKSGVPFNRVNDLLKFQRASVPEPTPGTLCILE